MRNGHFPSFGCLFCLNWLAETNAISSVNSMESEATRGNVNANNFQNKIDHWGDRQLDGSLMRAGPLLSYWT